MYLGACGRYQIHALEVHHCPEDELRKIAEACERVEMDVWNACEDFTTYLKKQSALIYASDGDEVVGFALFDISLKNEALVVVANECMVLRMHQGNGLPTLFLAILISHIRKDNRLRGVRRGYRYVTFVSTTVSFKLMEGFRRYRFLAAKSSFDPDSEIIEIARQYLEDDGLSLVDKANPFFVKAAFPRAVKLPAPIARPPYVPEGFSSERGDAFMCVCRIANFPLLGFMSWLVRTRYRFRFSKEILPISRMTREHVIYSRGHAAGGDGDPGR